MTKLYAELENGNDTALVGFSGAEKDMLFEMLRRIIANIEHSL